MSKKFSILLLASCAYAGMAAAQSGTGFSLFVDPTLLVPMPGTGSELRYDLGVMASLGADWVPSGLPFLAFKGAIDYSQVPFTTDQALQSIGASAGVGVRLGITNALSLGMAGRGGLGYGMLEGVGAMTPYAIAGVDASLYLTPSLRLSLGGGYLHQFAASDALYQGISASLTAGFNFNRMDTRPRLRMLELAFSPVFPVFYKHYDTNPLGTVTLVNEEGGSIQDVHVSLFAPQYMDAPKISLVIPSMKRGERKTVDLYALFTRQILSTLEPTKAQIQVSVGYEYSGARKEAKTAVTVVINHRNASTWDDDRKAASFVTLNDPAVMRLAKAAAGTARNSGYMTLDTNLRQAVGVFEELRLYGIQYVPDPSVPYEKSSKDDSNVDYLQFPAQTLDFHAGDCDDMSILYAALLEASGVESAFITVPGHIYTAFALGMTPFEGRAFFTNFGDIVEAEGKLWLPVEITILGDGFMRAWQIGARQWRDAAAKGEAKLYPVRDAWKLYEPVAILGDDASVVLPRSESLVQRYTASMDAFLTREMKPLIEAAKTQSSATPSPVAFNKLGIIYARYGSFDEAEKAFLACVKLKDYAPGYANLANVYLLRGDYRKALDAFKKALAISPRSVSALVGIAIASYELEDRAGAIKYIEQLSKIDEPAAGRYAYMQSAAGSRAASADAAPAVQWEE